MEKDVFKNYYPNNQLIGTSYRILSRDVELYRGGGGGGVGTLRHLHYWV